MCVLACMHCILLACVRALLLAMLSSSGKLSMVSCASMHLDMVKSFVVFRCGMRLDVSRGVDVSVLCTWDNFFIDIARGFSLSAAECSCR